MHFHRPPARLPRNLNESAILARNRKREQNKPKDVLHSYGNTPHRGSVLHICSNVLTHTCFETSRTSATASHVLPRQHERSAAIDLFGSPRPPPPRGGSPPPSLTEKLTPSLYEDTSFSSHFWLTPLGFRGPLIRRPARCARLQDLTTGGRQRARRAHGFPGKRWMPRHTQLPPPGQKLWGFLTVSRSARNKHLTFTVRFLGKLLFSSLSSLGGKQNN